MKNAENDEGLVVEVIDSALKFSKTAEDGISESCGGLVLISLHERNQPVLAEHLLAGILGIHDAIAEEDDGVAGLGGEAELFVLDIGEHAQRNAFGPHCGDFCTAADEWLD